MHCAVPPSHVGIPHLKWANFYITQDVFVPHHQSLDLLWQESKNRFQISLVHPELVDPIIIVHGLGSFRSCPQEWPSFSPVPLQKATPHFGKWNAKPVGWWKLTRWLDIEMWRKTLLEGVLKKPQLPWEMTIVQWNRKARRPFKLNKLQIETKHLPG